MADFGTIFSSRFAEILAKYADAGGATVSAQINAASGDSTSVTLNLSAEQETGEDGQTVSSTQANLEVNGVTTSATAEATGEQASASLDLTAVVQDGSVETQIAAEAEATGDSADPNIDATTGVDVSGLEAVDFQQFTDETSDDGSLTKESTLQGTWVGALPTLEDNSTLAETAPLDDYSSNDILIEAVPVDDLNGVLAETTPVDGFNSISIEPLAVDGLSLLL